MYDSYNLGLQLMVTILFKDDRQSTHPSNNFFYQRELYSVHMYIYIICIKSALNLHPYSRGINVTHASRPLPRLPGAPNLSLVSGFQLVTATLVIYSNCTTTTHPRACHCVAIILLLIMHIFPYTSPSIIIVCDRCSHEGAFIMQASDL